MNVEIINTPLRLDIYGFSGIAPGKDYTATAFKLSGKMWEIIKLKSLKNKGINVWVYEPDDRIFTGVELDNIPESESGLERKKIVLEKYAYYKHTGPYHLIKQVGLNMQNELKGRGFESRLPYIEIYGHWTSDETKAGTELLMAVD
jgi:hypothetical protein